MLLGDYVAVRSAHLASRAALCCPGGFAVVGEAGTVSPPCPQGEGWWGLSVGPTPLSHHWLREVVAWAGLSLLLFPLPLPVFTFLIWCVCLAPPWLAHGKLLQFGNPGQGEISFLESGSWPLFLPPPGAGQGLVPALPPPNPALPSWPPPCSAALFTLQFASLQVPPCKLLGFFQPVYFPSAKCTA